MVLERTQLALELEVFIRRATRQGVIRVEELVETFIALEPGRWPGLRDPRRVDVDALVEALAALPDGFLQTDQIFVVDRLERFPHAAVSTPPGPHHTSRAALRCGRLADGRFVLEARSGLPTLVQLVCWLCILRHEMDKARALLREEPDLLERLWAVSQQTFGADADANGPHDDPSEPPNDSARPQNAQPAAARPDTTTEAHDDETQPQSNGPDADGEPPASHAPPDDGQANADALQAILAQIAFQWGLDELELQAADAQTDGAIWLALLGDTELPTARLHTSLHPNRHRERYQRAGERIVTHLAEQGLAQRPVHLWVGPPVVVDCLSPYTRELSDVLVQWAAKHPEMLGGDLREREHPAGEDVLYALAYDFLRSDSNLAKERAAADRSVGIGRECIDDIAFETVDLGRIDPAVVDSRLVGARAVEHPAPVLLRVGPEPEDDGGALLRSLLDGLGEHIRSVTLVIDGSPINAPVGTVILPQGFVAWAGGYRWVASQHGGFADQAIAGYADNPTQGGMVLSTWAPQLLSPTHVGELARTHGLVAVESGAEGIVRASTDAMWAPNAPERPVRWAVVGADHTDAGRPTLTALSAQASVAIAKLRDVLVPPEPPTRRRQQSEPPPGPKQPSRAALAMRIKA